MTARDAGGIACRMFALYLGFYAFQELSLFLTVGFGLGTGLGRFSDYSLGQMIFRIVVIVFAAILLWVKSSSLWPSDNPIGSSSVNAYQWIKIFVLLFGIYIVTMSCTMPLLAILKAALQTRIEWPEIRPETLFVDSIRSLAGIGFIAYGSSGWKRVEVS